MKQIPMSIFLESFSNGAALIGRDATIVGLNSRLLEWTGAKQGRPCHEALAGSMEPCGFCPLEELMQGRTTDVVDADQVRHGRPCSVRVRLLPDVEEDGLILETVTFLADEQPAQPDQSLAAVPDLLRRLSGLLQISRDLMGHAPFEKKMEDVFRDLKRVLYDNSDVALWLEMDGKVYGPRPETISSPPLGRKIWAQDALRGYLYVCIPSAWVSQPAEDYFLAETAELIARQVEICDLEDKLRQSEERYRKLAANLAKEMWTRTEALAKETGYLEGILRCSDDMIITTDLESRIVEFNPAAERMLGWTAEEIQGRSATDLWVDPPEREKILQAVKESGGITNYETLLKTKSGTPVEISLTLSLLKDEHGRPVGTVGVSKDIGKEKAVRRELQRLNRNYRETIHFISHETKNSLIVMGGFLRRLLARETDSARKKELKIVYHHSQFLEAMSRDFLVMAELEHGEFQIRKELIRDFQEEVIVPAMIGLRERYPDSFESYDTSMGGVGQVELYGDAALLEIVYRNLFGNALKYRSEHGKIAFGVVPRSDSYVFNVWNEGPGVPLDEVERIFDKFYRVHDEHTRTKRGTGLGLYNIRRIIEAHGGRIWCESVPGRWINFLFALPRS